MGSKMRISIFYSWQNDLEPKLHRYFIEKAIKQAVVNPYEANLYVDYDRDTKGMTGSPDIPFTVFDKIDRSSLFICDVSIISQITENKSTPNPNVLIELGYASKTLGWDKIICLFDSNSGNIVDLPFDLRHRRITSYNPNNIDETKRLATIISQNIVSLYSNGKISNPISDYMKGKIDRAYLNIAQKLACIMFGVVSLSEGLSNVNNLLNLEESDIEDKLKYFESPAFIVLDTFEESDLVLQESLKEMTSSSKFPDEWPHAVITLIDWIRSYSYYVSSRNNPFPFGNIDGMRDDRFALVRASSINPANPVNSFLVLETYDEAGKTYVDPKGGKVINTTTYPCEKPSDLSAILRINTIEYGALASKIYWFIKDCNKWLDISGKEFILDPAYYFIK